MPQNTDDILRAIQSDNQVIVSNMFRDLIDEHKRNEAGTQKKFWLRYKQERSGVPIYQKEFANYEKCVERVPNDFYGDIVDLKTGYMGNEIIIEIDDRRIGETAADEQNAFLTRFAHRESTGDANSELVKMAAITGKAYRLLYAAADDADAHIMNIDPWEAVVYYDARMDRPSYGMRYWQVDVREFGMTRKSEIKESKRYRIEWYDETFVTYYMEDDQGLIVLDESKGTVGRQPHFFAGVPLIEFKNNEEALSEPKKVVDLIDAYDAITSDATSEVEQLRMAYMWARGAGMKLNAEFERQLEQTGIWPLPQDGEIGFVGKNLGGAAPFVMEILGEIRRNIYSFAKSIDLSQDKGGNMRVIGWQIAMLRLEMSAQVTERKFKKSYNRQYEMLTAFWRENKRVAIDPYSLRYVFTRRFPKDIDQEIDTLVKGMSVLPLETIYALMSFIDNPAELAKKFKEERPEMQSIISGLENAESELG